VNPAIENQHFDYTPYAYVYNNPLLFFDPVGLDSAQRAQAVAEAQDYVDSKPEGNSYEMRKKGGPGENVDCSGMVSDCVVAGGEEDPNYGNEPSGVLNIENNTTKIDDEKDVVAGNIVTFRNSKGYKYHTGLVKNVVRDKNGKITKVVYYHSHSGTGPDIGTFDVSNPGNLTIQGYYKWDTKPDAPQISTTSTTVVNQSNAGNSVRGIWNNIKLNVASAIQRLNNAIAGAVLKRF